MRELTTMETDYCHWMPKPTGAFARLIATEFRMYCPSLHTMTIFVGHEKSLWHYQADRFHLRSRITEQLLSESGEDLAETQRTMGSGGAQGEDLDAGLYAASYASDMDCWRNLWTQFQWPMNSDIWTTV